MIRALRPSVDDPSRHSRVLIAAALFALAWAVARACVQTITGDESDTYIYFVSRNDPFHWFPDGNNHVLNTMLMRLFTRVFGLSHLTVRLPALIGAALYISAAYTLVRLLSRDYWLRFAIFVCLVYNPFLFDFFVAARGYGMAAAFLLWAITFAAAARLDELDPKMTLRAVAAVSICLALSVSASFPFAFAGGITWLLLVLWLWQSEPGEQRPPRFGLRFLTASLVPGLLVALVLVGSVLRNWPGGKIWDGGSTVGEMLGSILSGALYKLNTELVNPWIHGKINWPGRRLPFVLLVLIVARVVGWWLDRSGAQGDRRSREILRLGAIAAGITILTVAAHATAFSMFGLLMPRGRTALYVIPLATLIAAAFAALPAASRFGNAIRCGLKAALIGLAIYFVGCMRLSYFKEWEWGADIRKVYPVIAWYNHNYCVGEVQSSWLYTGSLGFYRVLSGQESFKSFPAIVNETDYDLSKSVYVLHANFNGPFIEREKLKVVYRGEATDVVVAVREDAVSGPVRNCTVRPF